MRQLRAFYQPACTEGEAGDVVYFMSGTLYRVSLTLCIVAVKALNDSTRRSATVDTGSDSLMCWWSTVIDSRGIRDSLHVLEMDNVRDVT